MRRIWSNETRTLDMTFSTDTLAMQQGATERTNVLQSSICFLSPPGDTSTLIALGIAAVTFPICIYFLARVLKVWVGPTSNVNLPRSNTPEWRPASVEASTATSMTSSCWQLLSGHWKRVQRRCNNRLNTALLWSWIVLTLDQVNLMLMLASYQWICPESNCINGPELITHHCPGGFFLGVMLHVQPLGSSLFVVATINRFVNVYNVLSQSRARLLKAALYWVGLTSQDRQRAAGIVDLVWLMHDMSLLLSYSVFALADLFSLALGLHYIRQTRNEIKSATAASLQMESIDISASLPMDEVGDNKIGGEDAKLPCSQSGTSSGSTGAAQPNSSASKYALLHKVRVKHKSRAIASTSALRKQYTAQVTVWTLTAITLLVVYLLVQLLPGVLRSLHAQILAAVMTLILKVFAGSITLAISSMTRLVVFDSS